MVYFDIEPQPFCGWNKWRTDAPELGLVAKTKAKLDLDRDHHGAFLDPVP